MCALLAGLEEPFDMNRWGSSGDWRRPQEAEEAWKRKVRKARLKLKSGPCGYR